MPHISVLRSSMLFAISSGTTNARVPLPGVPTRNALPAELVDLQQRVGAAVKNPERLVVEAREHHDAVRRRRRRDAAKQERDVDPRLRVTQKVKVLRSARGRPFLDLHSGAFENFDVATRITVIHAGLDARRQDDSPRWSGTDELGKRP